MYFRLISNAIKKNPISFQRFFRTNQRLLKDVEGIKESASQISKSQPIKYSTSDAGKWKAIYSSSGESYFETPRIQPLVIVMSLTAFMVYFCILREENDLDDWLREIETDVPVQLERAQLRAEIEHGRRKGIDVTYQVKRLKELGS